MDRHQGTPSVCPTAVVTLTKVTKIPTSVTQKEFTLSQKSYRVERCVWLFSHIIYLTFVYKVIILHKFAYFDCSQAVSLSWGGWGSNPSRRHLVISADILGCHNQENAMVIQWAKAQGAVKYTTILDFPGHPLVKTSQFHCRGHGLDPYSGN